MKKIVALILAASMVLMLAACGSSGAASTTSTASQPAAAAASTTSTAAAATSAVSTASAAATSGSVRVPSADDPIRVAYIPMSTAGSTNEIVKLAFDDVLAGYSGGATVDWFDPGYDPMTQITMINDCVSQGYDAIMMEAMDPISLRQPVTEAEAAGIPVCTMNITCDTVHSLFGKGVDYLAGWTACEDLISMYGADSEQKLVFMDCPADQASTNRQTAGFEDCMTEKTNWTLVEHQYIDNFSQEIANTTMRDLLTKYGPGDVTLVFGMMADVTVGAMQAIEAAGRTDIKCYGNIGSPAMFQALKEGNETLLGFTYIDQYAQFVTALQEMLYLVQAGISAGTAGYDTTPATYFGVIAVNKDNVEEVFTRSHWGDTKSGQAG